MRKIPFPFYKERHAFLLEKWWFRFLIVVYVIVFVATLFTIFFWHMDQSVGWCHRSLELLSSEYPALYGEQLVECGRIAHQALPSGVALAVIGTLAIHYLSQLIFFKIIIDFIAVGVKRTA